MIHMPHRSVTRYFIPLIDVLLLLFCMFLLMPIAKEAELEKSREDLSERPDSAEMLQRELARRTEKLDQYEKLQPQLPEMSKLKEELDRLKAQNVQDLQQRAYFQIIDVDGKNGAISHFDQTAQAPTVLASEEAARKLIKEHQKEAGKKEVYYYFLYPRPEGGFPTRAQERRYKKWFEKVANSLREIEP